MGRNDRVEHVRATETFTGSRKVGTIKVEIGRDEDGKPITEKRDERESFTVTKGTLLPSDDPVVEGYPHFFGRAAETRPDVEQATAAPGERR